MYKVKFAIFPEDIYNRKFKFHEVFGLIKSKKP